MDYIIFGLMYLHGRGVEKDYHKAKELFEEASKAGNHKAECQLDGMRKQK